MLDEITISINDRVLKVGRGTSAASAIIIAEGGRIRTSVGGDLRGALCGMGICFECRATIDGRRHQRSCQTLCEEGMTIRTRD